MKRSYAIIHESFTMFPCSIAFMDVKSVFWKIFMKITHHSISSDFCYNWCWWYSRNSSVSSNDVINMFFFSLPCFSFLFLVSFFCKGIWTVYSIKYKIITSIYIYLYEITLLSILKEWKEYILHTKTICFAYSKTIYLMSFSICECILTEVSFLKSFYTIKYIFSFYFTEFFWISESMKCFNIFLILFFLAEPSSYNNRSCPWSTTSFIDANNIVHICILDKSCLFPIFSYDSLAERRQIYAHILCERKVWTSLSKGKS